MIVDISHENVDRPFEYRIPGSLEDKVHVGSSVVVPFGKGSTRRQGYVIEIVAEPEFDPSRIKDILEPASEDVPIDSVMIRLAWWMKNTYGSTMISALKTVLPSRTKKKSLEKKVIHRLVDGKAVSEALFEAGRKHQKAKVRVLQELVTEENLPYELVKEKLHVTQNTLSSLERQGLITIDVTRVYRNPVKAGLQNASVRKLSDSQQHIVDQVMQDFDGGQKKTYLIHGITGSGKTEVYIELVAECLKRGKQAIVLIPEIALTYQTVMRFYKRFGDRVSVMNSTLSPGEKYDQCERAKKGDIDIIIGPRSALFTPFPRLGLIIIDEEHEPSYKSETMPKYHARETAKELARLHGASVVLGSATPSMDSYYQAKMGQYTLFHLTERLTGNTLPRVEIADLRKELKEGNRSIFSRKLDQLMEQRLQAGEQTMLFINRRGYAGFVSCRACGHVMKCPHCDVSLSEHMGGRLVCHYCGYEQPMVHQCPECGSKYILGFKAGTEAIEQKLHERFPSARILRMDGDTTRKKESYEAILSAFSDGQADILLGTQMIVKGHDFPNVTLVGILAADMSLFAGDYRASERTFQLLTQAAGRAGRGDIPGEVVIQTYQPDHYSIRYAASQDYEGFYEEEILYRELAHYPPAMHMLAVLVTARSEKRAQALAGELAELIKKKAEKEHISRDKLVTVGPSSAALSKLQDIYRYVIYLKSSSYDLLVMAKDAMEEYLGELALKDGQVQFDFDPMSHY